MAGKFFADGVVVPLAESAAAGELGRRLQSPRTQRVHMCGWSLRWTIETQVRALRDFVGRGGRLRILLLDPEAPSVARLDQLITRTDLRKRRDEGWPAPRVAARAKRDIEETLSTLLDNGLLSPKGKFVHVSSLPLPVGILMVEGQGDDVWASVQIYPVHPDEPYGHRLCFTVRSRSGVWRILRKQFDDAWDDRYCSNAPKTTAGRVPSPPAQPLRARLSKPKEAMTQGPMEPTNPRTKVFVSYSHTDTSFLRELRKHLAPIESRLEVWDDTRIEPGKRWLPQIQAALAEAKAGLLLVSPDFLASSFITQREVPPLLVAAEAAGVPLLCVYVRPSLAALREYTYREPNTGEQRTAMLPDFQGLNDANHALSTLTKPKREKALVEIAKKVLAAASAEPGVSRPSATNGKP